MEENDNHQSSTQLQQNNNTNAPTQTPPEVEVINHTPIEQNIVIGKMPEDQQVSEHIRESVANNSNPKKEAIRRSSGLSAKSDNSEFLDWKISNIKEGQFEFTKADKESNKDIIKDKLEVPTDKRNSNQWGQIKALTYDKPELTSKKVQSEGRNENNEESKKNVKLAASTERNVKSKGKTANSTFKMIRTEGSHKKAIKNDQKQLSQQFEQILSKMKSVNLVFSHFCKDNNLSSIKSTLFEDKPKVMSEMSLNKWMVFCKQFEIVQKLYNIKSDNKTKTVSESRAREIVRMRQFKQVETTLVNIFKSVSNNKTKIAYEDFVAGIVKIFGEFKHTYSQGAESHFLEEVLHCQSQKQSLKKLSSLKFTHGTPQISYEKRFPELNRNTIFKSRTRPENHTQNIMGTRKFNHNKSMPGNIDKFKLNPVLRQAKNTLHSRKTESKYSNQKQLKKQQLYKRGQRSQSGIQKKLVEYFQSNEDEILDNYFKLEAKGSKKREGDLQI